MKRDEIERLPLIPADDAFSTLDAAWARAPAAWEAVAAVQVRPAALGGRERDSVCLFRVDGCQTSS